MNIGSKTLAELTDFVVRDFEERRLPAETRSRLLDLRLSGVSTLRFLGEPLITATDDDVEWYQTNQRKQSLYDRKTLRRLVRDADWRGGRLDLGEAKDYIKDCSLQEREALKEYIAENLEFLTQQYSLYVTEWFTAWYAFWADQTDIYKVPLDWNIYFSILGERPPPGFLVRFNEIAIKLNTIERSEIRPRYLKWCWDDEEIRNKVLRGEMFRHNNIICPYSTVFNYIHRRQDRMDEITETHKEAKRTMNRSLQGQRDAKDRLCRRILELQSQGYVMAGIEDGRVIFEKQEE